MKDTPLQDIERRLLEECYPIVLGDRPVGPIDDFFALGGDSIGMIRLFSVVQDAFGIEVPARDFFADPTLQTLAGAVLAAQSAAAAGLGADATSV